MKSRLLLIALTCCCIFCSCSQAGNDQETISDLQNQIEELQQRNTELQQDVLRLQAERDSLDDIIDRVRQRIANMNY
ncbi:MAG: hypothetical protein IJU19_05335 [Bacteroidales bacterium]|nr:hypothetical protein [Bacteroidales bacterium]